jgi:hypothetical protein
MPRKKAQTLRFGPVNPSFEKMEETINTLKNPSKYNEFPRDKFSIAPLCCDAQYVVAKTLKTERHSCNAQLAGRARVRPLGHPQA